MEKEGRKKAREERRRYERVESTIGRKEVKKKNKRVGFDWDKEIRGSK